MGPSGLTESTRKPYQSDSFVKRIMEEKGLTVPEMSAKSHLPRKTILYFLNRPYMTTGNRPMWEAAWARALGVTQELVHEEMKKLFADRYFPCDYCKTEIFRMQNHQRFCSETCRKKWRKETPKKYRETGVHSSAFSTSYKDRKRKTAPVKYTETGECESRDFQSEIDEFLKKGGTVKNLKTGFVEHQITIPYEELESKLGELTEIRVEEI